MKKTFAFKLFVILFFLLCKNTYSQTTIYMQKEGGVYTVPCKVNGINLKFIFDTGASDVTISLTEANFMLKNGYLKPDDLIGKQKYSDATGHISEGTVINIRKLEFSGIILYNVKASIVHELSAPLLLGQTAMAKLGKFQFDPNKGTLTIINSKNNLTNKQPNNSNTIPKPKINTRETLQVPDVIQRSIEGVFATISTNKGDIALLLEYKKTPVTVANFIALAEGKNTIIADENLLKKPFYDGLKFHRVIKDFMIQGGDPSGSGSGGPGYEFKDEFTDLKFDKGGVLAMANSGLTTNGSQFFITHKETPWLNNKHTIFGHVIQGMDIVNSITQEDSIIKVSIIRKGEVAKEFDAPKVFSDYYANKAEDQKKQDLVNAENKAKQAAIEAEAKRAYTEKYGPVLTAKKVFLATTKAKATTTPSGLAYKIIKKGTGIKPANGTTFYFHYAGYFEDGTLFDSSYEEVNKSYGKFDANRAAQNGYQAFPFEAGKKDGMIPGFIEALALMSYGDRAVVFIPSKLAYGERGAGGVIPPNTNLVFELEMFEKQPAPKQ